MLSWTRPYLSRKTNAIVHHVSFHRRYGDEASSRVASRIFQKFELTSEFEVEVRSRRLLSSKTYSKKKKTSTRGCVHKFLERGDDGKHDQFPISKVGTRSRSSKFEVWRLRSNFLKVRRLHLQKVNLILSLSPSPSSTSSVPQVRKRVEMWDGGEERKESRERPDPEVPLPTSDFELRTSNLELGTWNLELRTSNFELRTSNFELRCETYNFQLSSRRL